MSDRARKAEARACDLRLALSHVDTVLSWIWDNRRNVYDVMPREVFAMLGRAGSLINEDDEAQRREWRHVAITVDGRDKRIADLEAQVAQLTAQAATCDQCGKPQTERCLNSCAACDDAVAQTIMRGVKNAQPQPGAVGSAANPGKRSVEGGGAGRATFDDMGRE